MQIRELVTTAELEQAYPIIHELRPQLGRDDYSALYEAARACDGYSLVGLYDRDVLVAAMGLRVLHDFVHGRHLYVDDLVVTESRRANGLGARLLQYAEQRARSLGCRGLRLCTGVDHRDAQRFYERNGWSPRALAFKKALR